MRKMIGIDKEAPLCKFVSDKRHPNIRRKKEISLTMNIRKMRDTIKLYDDGKLTLEEMTRIFQASPKKQDKDWLEAYVFDIDYPHQDLESPRAQFMKIYYKDSRGKNKPKKIFIEGPSKDNTGWLYCFEVFDIDDAEYIFPFVERVFIDADIMIFKPEYRDANDNTWKPLNGRRGRNIYSNY